RGPRPGSALLPPCALGTPELWPTKCGVSSGLPPVGTAARGLCSTGYGRTGGGQPDYLYTATLRQRAGATACIEPVAGGARPRPTPRRAEHAVPTSKAVREQPDAG